MMSWRASRISAGVPGRWGRRRVLSRSTRCPAFGKSASRRNPSTTFFSESTCSSGQRNSGPSHPRRQSRKSTRPQPGAAATGPAGKTPCWLTPAAGNHRAPAADPGPSGRCFLNTPAPPAPLVPPRSPRDVGERDDHPVDRILQSGRAAPARRDAGSAPPLSHPPAPTQPAGPPRSRCRPRTTLSWALRPFFRAGIASTPGPGAGTDRCVRRSFPNRPKTGVRRASGL